MLLIGYGNAGRQDDGLGPAFAARIEVAGLDGVEVDIDYQLTVDHAPMVAEADLVVIADALMGGDEPFTFTPLVPGDVQNLASHALTPAAVLTLASTLFGRVPEAYVLGISGVEFGQVQEGLSATAQGNLELAEHFFLDWHANRQPRRAARAAM